MSVGGDEKRQYGKLLDTLLKEAPNDPLHLQRFQNEASIHIARPYPAVVGLG